MESPSGKYEMDQQKVIGKKGGLRTMPFIIANEAFEKVSSYGLIANMILYLKNEYNMSNAQGANVLFLWSATANFLPIIGAFLSDSYFGKFRVIALGSLCTLLGMMLLFLTAAIPQATPPNCNSKTPQTCMSPKPPQLALLFSAFTLMAIGAGGIRPCSLAFGADQLDKPNNPKNATILQSFFNWYYASVGVSLMISVTVIVYIQDKAGWVVGFGVPVGLMFLSSLLFLFGSSLYVKVKPNKSLFTGFAQVIVVSWKNKHLALPREDSDEWYYHKGSNLVAPTDRLRILNKACMRRKEDVDANGRAIDEWKMCTVNQVEELKALIKVLPIWSSGIMLSVTISQHAFPVIQASTMDRRMFPNFKIPPSSLAVFGLLTLTIWVAIYDRILVPNLRKITKRPRGLSIKQRMGIGLVISCIATATSAMVESRRRNEAIKQGLEHNPVGVVNMTVMWLVPQHCLVGLAEAFNAIGQIEFYYSQFPSSMASIAVALFALSVAVGNLMGSGIVGVVDNVSKNGGRVSWVSNNINKGHYDYYYWVLTVLSVVNVFYFFMCTWAYGSCEDKKVWNEGEVVEEEEMSEAKGSPLIYGH